jgi:hypothetical protein
VSANSNKSSPLLRLSSTLMSASIVEMENNETKTMRKVATWAQEQPKSFDHITARCADLSIQTDDLRQDDARRNLQCRKKRRADGTFKNERAWSMTELKYALQNPCINSKASEAKLRMDADNLKRRIAVLEGLQRRQVLCENGPAGSQSQQDINCNREASLQEDGEADMMDWNGLREDTLR